MRRSAAMPAAILLLAALLPALPDCGGEPPAALPDLQAVGIDFSFFGDSVELVLAKASFMFPLTVNVFIRNVGPGKSTAANLSVFQDGRLLAMFPVGAALNVTGHENQTWATYMWNISGLAPGWHVLRAEVMDPAGDMNASDNSVERSLHFLDRRPELNMSLSPETAWAEVTSTLPAFVEFSGEVRTETTDGIVPTVSLSSSTDIGWPTSVIPGPEFQTDALVKTFKVRVTVPQGTDSDIQAQVVVNGRVDIGGLTSTAESRAHLNVSSYFCATVECERPHQTIGPGEHETFEYYVTNIGNAYDSYLLGIPNRNELEQKGWILNLSRADIPGLRPGERAMIRIRATPPRDWSVYKDETTAIKVNVTSKNNASSPVFYSGQLPATVRVRGYNTPGVVLFSTTLLLLVAAGSVALYVRFRRGRRKTALDYDRELGLVKGGR